MRYCEEAWAKLLHLHGRLAHSLPLLWPPCVLGWLVSCLRIWQLRSKALQRERKRWGLQEGEDWSKGSGGGHSCASLSLPVSPQQPDGWPPESLLSIAGYTLNHRLPAAKVCALLLDLSEIPLCFCDKSRGVCVDVTNGMNSQGQGGGGSQW